MKTASEEMPTDLNNDQLAGQGQQSEFQFDYESGELESSTSHGEDHDESTDAQPSVENDSGEDPAGYTKRINQKHYELMEERRKAEALQRKLDELEKGTQQEMQRPNIPPMPDPYDDDFKDKIKAREEAIVNAAKFDAEKQAKALQQESERNSNYQKAISKLQQTVETYSERAKKLNVSDDELRRAGELVGAYGINDQIVSHILSDDKGPLITTYLAKNPNELDTLNSLDPMRAAVYLETGIKSKLVNRSKTNAPPPPPDTLGGGGAPHKERGPQGAKYE